MTQASVPPGRVGTPAHHLPKVWIGYVIAAGFLAGEVFYFSFHPASGIQLPWPFGILNLVGLLYWFYCQYRLHQVLAEATGHSHPVTPRGAVVYQLIPLYSVYWQFRWPNQIANFVNARSPSSRMARNWAGLFLLLSRFVQPVDTGLSLLVAFAVLTYLNHKIVSVLEPQPAEEPAMVNVAIGTGMVTGFSVLLAQGMTAIAKSPEPIREVAEFAVICGLMALATMQFTQPLLQRLYQVFGLAGGEIGSRSGQSRAVALVLLLGVILDELLRTAMHDHVAYAAVLLFASLLFPAAITYLWIHAQYHSRSAAMDGALFGTVLGAVGSCAYILAAEFHADWLTDALSRNLAPVLLDLAAHVGSGLPGSHTDLAVALSQVTVAGAALVVAGALYWGLLGFAGGLSIDRRRSPNPAQSVGLSVAAPALLVEAVIIAAPRVPAGTHGSPVVALQSAMTLVDLKSLLATDFARPLGWALGLWLFPFSEVILKWRQRAKR